MLFKRISRTAPEQVFIVVKNVSGSTVTAGYSVVWDVSAADGVRVSRANTKTLCGFAGVADADIANGEYGLAQVYGYRSSAYITRSTITGSSGDALELTNSDWGLMPAATVASPYASFAFLVTAVTSTTGTANSWTTSDIFLRAL